MDIFGKKCFNCGHMNTYQAAFCAQCGMRLAGGEVECCVCGTHNRSDARFCRDCGRSLDVTAAPEIRDNRWARNEGDFAVRLDASNLAGMLSRGIVVNVGTKALLLEGGANCGVLGPGTHTLDTLDKRLLDWVKTGIGSQVSVLLVDVTPAELEFNAGGIFTKDSIKIGLSIRLQAQVQEPARFLTNILGGQERFTRLDLTGYLYPEVTQVVEKWVAKHTVQELAEDINLREKLELTLEEALRTTFRQTGLEFLQVRSLNFNMEHLDRIKGIRSRYALQVSEAEAEAEGLKTWLAAANKVDLQKFTQETTKVENDERRAELYKRMLQAVVDGKIDELRFDAQFEAFLNDMDRQKLLNEKERIELLKTWQDETEDRDRARAHLQAKLYLEREYTIRTIDLQLRTDLSKKDLEAELQLERMRTDKQFEIDSAKFDYDLKRRHSEAEFNRQQVEEQFRMDEMARKAKLTATGEESDEEIRQLDKELELALKGMRGLKQVRHDAERNQLELEQQKMDFEWSQRQRELEIEMQHERIRMEHELNRLDKLGQLGTDALIAASPAEQGKILADLKKTEALKGMSEEQILAAAAKDSPDVAHALAEKYRAIAEGKSGERERDMYEKLLAEKESRERATIEGWDRASTRAKETTERALDRIADVAQAFARGQSGIPLVTSNPSSGRAVTTAGILNASVSSIETKTCLNCGRFIIASARHCEHCGHKFEGVS